MPVNEIPDSMFEQFPSNDKGRAWDRHYEGNIDRHKWIHIIGEAECGCVFDLDVRVEGGVTFRQAVNNFAARFFFNQHTEAHGDICAAALPPGIEDKEIFYDVTLGELLAKTQS